MGLEIVTETDMDIIIQHTLIFISESKPSMISFNENMTTCLWLQIILFINHLLTQVWLILILSPALVPVSPSAKLMLLKSG